MLLIRLNYTIAGSVLILRTLINLSANESLEECFFHSLRVARRPWGASKKPDFLRATISPASVPFDKAKAIMGYKMKSVERKFD
jgi:hypothetical protein